MTRDERTGWRDERLSARHREYGFHLPAVDVDFLLIEYDAGKPMAAVDYKHELARWPIDHHSPSIRALVHLADRTCNVCGTPQRLPLFATRYADDMTWYEPDPLNEIARVWVPRRERMSEFRWVSLLYGMRLRTMPRDVASRLAA